MAGHLKDVSHLHRHNRTERDLDEADHGRGAAASGQQGSGPFWFGIIYLCQYIFSMYGIKALFKIKDREPKEKKVREPKQKKEKKPNPVEGMKKISRNCYKDEATGSFYDRKGNKL